MPLALETASQLTQLFRRRQASPVEVTQAVLDRIGSLNERFNIYCVVDAERALEAAAQSEKRWLSGNPLSELDGVPTSIKELQITRDWPTSRSSAVPEFQITPGEDAPGVANLRAAGAVLLGKTTSPEIGWKGVTDSPRYGITRNAWDPTKTAGGSSGGAAAAAALGLGVLHTGSDGGGSIRIPAAFNGVVGIKASFGRVPVYPPSPFGLLSHVGPIARTVADCASMLQVMMRPDPRDGTSLPPLDRLNVDPIDLATLRIAYSPNLGNAKCDLEVLASVEGAIDLLRRAGASVTEVGQVFDDPLPAFQTLWFSACAASVAHLPETSLDLLDPGLREAADLGARMSSVDVVGAHFARMKLMAQMRQFHVDYDVLITPAMPITAFDADLQVADASQRWWMEWTPFTYPFNITGQPAASIPCGLSSQQLPIGLQIVGRAYDDQTVIGAAAAVEALLPKQPAPSALAKVAA